MEHILKKADAWPHGNIHGKWRAQYPRIVDANGKDHRPTELVPEDLKKMAQNGVDTIWQTTGITFHFIEAKFSGNAYGLFRQLEKGIKLGTILPPPPSLKDRDRMLWVLLGERLKGTQMGTEWLRNSTKTPAMKSASNLKNRWVYLMLGSDAVTNPFVTAAQPHSGLKLGAAAGMAMHLEATLELLASGDHYNIKIHDKHKKTHGISDTFDHIEIDRTARNRKLANKLSSKNDTAEKKSMEKNKNSSTSIPDKKTRRK